MLLETQSSISIAEITPILKKIENFATKSADLSSTDLSTLLIPFNHLDLSSLNTSFKPLISLVVSRLPTSSNTSSDTTDINGGLWCTYRKLSLSTNLVSKKIMIDDEVYALKLANILINTINHSRDLHAVYAALLSIHDIAAHYAPRHAALLHPMVDTSALQSRGEVTINIHDVYGERVDIKRVEEVSVKYVGVSLKDTSTKTSSHQSVLSTNISIALLPNQCYAIDMSPLVSAISALGVYSIHLHIQAITSAGTILILNITEQFKIVDTKKESLLRISRLWIAQSNDKILSDKIFKEIKLNLDGAVPSPPALLWRVNRSYESGVHNGSSISESNADGYATLHFIFQVDCSFPLTYVSLLLESSYSDDDDQNLTGQCVMQDFEGEGVCSEVSLSNIRETSNGKAGKAYISNVENSLFQSKGLRTKERDVCTHSTKTTTYRVTIESEHLQQYGAGRYKVTSFLASPFVDIAVSQLLGYISILSPPQKTTTDTTTIPLYKRSLLHDSDVALAALPDFEHVMKSPPKRADDRIALAFTVLSLLPLLVFLRQVHPLLCNISFANTPFLRILFVALVGSVLGVLSLYWLSLPGFLLYDVLRYFSVLLPLIFLTGTKSLQLTCVSDEVKI